MKEEVEIRRATKEDWSEIWPIIRAVIRCGDSFVFDPATPEEQMKAYWMNTRKHTYVALISGAIAGTYIFTENQPGLGSHIANASYMVNALYRGHGVGQVMGQHSLQQAREAGFQAMQFNIVVGSNEAAIRLWKKLGFQVIGEIPDAFRHQKLGLTDALIMYRKL